MVVPVEMKREVYEEYGVTSHGSGDYEVARLALASRIASESPLNPDDVWVNTKSGKYWKPGSHYFGKTKQGEYLSEEEAVQKGYRPANGTGE
jgi:hypothetical protein